MITLRQRFDNVMNALGAVKNRGEEYEFPLTYLEDWREVIDAAFGPIIPGLDVAPGEYNPAVDIAEFAVGTVITAVEFVDEHGQQIAEGAGQFAAGVATGLGYQNPDIVMTQLAIEEVCLEAGPMEPLDDRHFHIAVEMAAADLGDSRTALELYALNGGLSAEQISYAGKREAISNETYLEVTAPPASPSDQLSPGDEQGREVAREQERAAERARAEEAARARNM